MKAVLFGLLTGAVVTAPTNAYAESSGFVEANLLSIFYHELGHAVIDIEGVPIFGQEEDAADVFSILLIHAFFESESAEALAYDAALGFWGEAEFAKQEGVEPSWWDTHGPDEQRFYNTACIFYGADPEARGGYAKDLGLPEDRAEGCAEEFELAMASWGAVLDSLEERGSGNSLVFDAPDDSLTSQIVAEEIEALNASLSLSDTLTIVVESCGEANAFYDPNDRSIVMCSEFEDHLKVLQDLL
ncbi:MAG: DUF4344 domain-containing metallopeptidase [Boseongicola sp.]|nr:DUF4344 domain-containing metallopeptidase [Boseongicola sp.]